MQKLSWLILCAAVLFASVGLMALNDAEQVKKEAEAMFTGHEDHFITLEEGALFTRNYRDANPESPVVGGYVGRDAIEAILAQDGVVGLRNYYGQFEDGRPNMVIVGVLEDGSDLYEGVIAEKWFPCPPFCGYENPLNSSELDYEKEVMGAK